MKTVCRTVKHSSLAHVLQITNIIFNFATLCLLNCQIVFFVSIFSEIEKSGTIPMAKPRETEQSETDCDVGETLEANAPVDQPAFVNPPERWV